MTSLEAAVESVAGQDPPAEIVIVIDHNEPLRMGAELRFPGFSVVANSYARGLSGARNTGIEAAKGEVVAFLDDDATARPDWLMRLGGAFADPHVVGAGGAVWPRWLEGRPEWFPPEFDWVVGCSYRGQPTSPQPVRNLIGCNMSFIRNAIVSAGGFRSGIGRVGSKPLGGKETELCIRLRLLSPESIILYDPRIAVDHDVPRARSRFSYFVSRCVAEGISKAQIARLVGTRYGLSSERRHVAFALPRALVDAARAAVGRGDAWGFVRALVVIVGLVAAMAGYATGMTRGAWRSAG